MKVIEIKNVVRREFPIYYRRLYKGIAVMELVHRPIEFPLDFQIEHKATGNREIALTLEQKVDYPLVPLQKELKRFIGELDSAGQLPG